ncbi:MAG: glycosyltransferase [Thermoleophilia bacterium]|nr:glycosyltransferase [Thermoleophilia bacterium]
MRVAIAHEWLTTLGGSERVVETLLEEYPGAPVYTTFLSDRNLPESVAGWDVRTSFVQNLPFLHRISQKYIPLFPLAFESFDLTGYDVVITSSSACSKGVLTGPETLNICYCYTPLRYAWQPHLDSRLGNANPMVKACNDLVVHYLRLWDRLASDRVDHFIAISEHVAARIAKFYRREATVIYPPVDVERFPVVKCPRDYFLVVSRLVPYKRVELAVKAFTRLGLPLKVVGDGPERERLEAMAGPTIEFLGFVPEKDLPGLISGCLALVFPGEEDFGIVPVEAMAAGRPVIGLARGGLKESAIDGKTAVMFPEATVESLIDAVARFRPGDFNPAKLSRHAARFSKERFRKEFSQFVDARVKEAGIGPAGRSR